MNNGQILLVVLAVVSFVIFLFNKVEINHPPKFNEIKDWIEMLLIASWLGLASYLIMVPSLFN